jgi:uncharacterized caspase-like protein
MNRRTALRCCLGALLAAAYPAIGRAQNGAGERRLALVIGNGDYPFSPLKNPANDAREMAGALRALGFDVDYYEDAGKRLMLAAIRSFVLRAKSYDVRLFYYAGHGVQVDGRNYLIPTDADIQSESDVAAKSADVSEMLERLGHNGAGVNVVILDACRNNPFADGATVLPDGRRLKFRGPTPAGLAAIDAPAGTLIAFATAPGAVAIDGLGASHSLYTKHLLAHLNTPGLPVEQLFKRVRVAVTAETRRQQVPWESSSLMGDFCFRTANGGGCRYDGALFNPQRPRAEP